MTHTFEPDLDSLAARARSLVGSSGRAILGICGSPGVGKSTLAGELAACLGRFAVVVPLDGFPLANAELVRLGRRDRKGAPDTFDANGYAALLERLRNPGRETIYAPAFRREIEEPVAGAIPVDTDVPLVITEGNYLLCEDGPWAAVRPRLDECWYVDGPEAERVRRLIARHIEFGKAPAEAHEWVHRSDESNARLIAATRAKADLVVRW